MCRVYERTAMLMGILPPAVNFIRELWNRSLILLSDKWKNFLDARLSSFVYVKTQLHP